MRSKHGTKVDAEIRAETVSGFEVFVRRRGSRTERERQTWVAHREKQEGDDFDAMSDPVTKKKTGVFEDFPLPERKHFDAHRAARGSLGSGFAPMEEEKQAFAHIRRDSAKGDSHER